MKNDKKSKQQFSVELSNNIKNDIYAPAIKKLVDRLSAFDDLFQSEILSLKIADDFEAIGHADDIVKYGLAFWTYKTIADSIVFRLEYDHLKKSLGGRGGYIIDFKLRFSLYYYEIEFGTGMIVLKKEYGFAPSAEAVDDVIN